MTFNIEIIGFIASAFIVSSLLMASILKLRIFGVIGATCFLVYGIFINSFPIIITNAFNIGIHIFYLYSYFRKKNNPFSYLSIIERRKYKLLDFIQPQYQELVTRFPNYTEKKLDYAFAGNGKIYLALKNLKTVGFAFYIKLPESSFIINDEERKIIQYIHDHLFPEETAYLVVDFITKKYYGMGLADQLYKMLSEEITEFRFLIVFSKFSEKRFIKLLKKQGYQLEKSFDHSGLYVKDLSK